MSKFKGNSADEDYVGFGQGNHSDNAPRTAGFWDAQSPTSRARTSKARADALLWEHQLGGLFYGFDYSSIDKDDTFEVSPGEEDGTSMHQPGREVMPDEESQDKNIPWVTWALNPLGFTLNRLKVPIFGAYDIIVRPSVAIGVRISSLFYAALPLIDPLGLNSALAPTLMPYDKWFAERTDYVATHQCLTCRDWMAPKIVATSSMWTMKLQHLCSHRLAEYMANNAMSEFAMMSPGLERFKPFAFPPRAKTEDQLVARLPVSLRQSMLLCTHGGVDDLKPAYPGNVMEHTADGLGIILPERSYRPNANYQGLRCARCYGNKNHSWNPEAVELAIKPDLSWCPPQHMRVYLTLVQRWRAMVASEFEATDSFYVTAVQGNYVETARLPTDMRVVLMAVFENDFETVRALNPRANITWFQVPSLMIPRAIASLRVLLPLSTSKPVKMYLINAELRVRTGIDLGYLRSMGLDIASIMTGNIVPFNASTAVIKGGVARGSLLAMWTSFHLFGGFYGWEEIYVGNTERALVLSMGSAIAPGILAPLCPPADVGVPLAIMVADKLRRPENVFVGHYAREFIFNVSRRAERAYDDSQLTFWHVLADPRPVFDDHALVDRYYTEHHHASWRPTSMVSSEPGRHVVQELVHSLGGIVWHTFGTHGDIVPIRALARHLARWAVPVFVVRHNNDDEGYELLDSATRGGDPPLNLFARARTWILQAPPAVHIVPYSLAPLRGLTYSLAPPADVIYALRVSTNLLVTIGHALMGVFSDVHFNIGAYARPGWLPRSANGETFLTTRKNKGTGKIGGAWGSDQDAPMGYEQIKPIPAGDHETLFQEYDVVYTHGGAGTVQTAASSGARVVVASASLDRDYRDPYDAGRGVAPGSDPDNIWLALADLDVRFLAVWLRRNMLKPWKLASWYGVARPSLFAFRLLILYLIYQREHKLAIVSSEPVATLIMVLFRTRPSIKMMVGLYVAAKAVDRVLSAWNVTYYELLVHFGTLNLKMSASPLGVYVAQRYNLFFGLAAAYLGDRFYLPIARAVQSVLNLFLRKRTQDPLVFLEWQPIFWSGSIPVLHTALVCPERGERYEGHALADDLYQFRVEPGRVKSPFLFPTHLDWDKVKELPSPIGRYSLAWNCQTGLLLNLQELAVDLGPFQIGLWVTALIGAAIYGGVIGGITLAYALLRMIPQSVGIVSLENSTTMILRTLLQRLYSTFRVGNQDPALSILEWWRTLAMPFTASSDQQVDLFRKEIEQFAAKPILWRLDTTQISQMDRRLDELVYLGVPRGVMDILRSDYYRQQEDAAFRDEVLQAKKTLFAAAMKLPEFSAFGVRPSEELEQSLCAKLAHLAPSTAVREVLGLNDVTVQAYTDKLDLLAPAQHRAINDIVSAWRRHAQDLTQPHEILEAAKEMLKSAKSISYGAEALAGQMIATEEFVPEVTLPNTVVASSMLGRKIAQGFLRFGDLTAQHGPQYQVWFSDCLRLAAQINPAILGPLQNYFSRTNLVKLEVIEGVLHPEVANITGEALAAVMERTPDNGTVFGALPGMAHMMLDALATTDEPVDMPLRRALWKIFETEGVENLSRVESMAHFVAMVRNFAEQNSIPFSAFGALLNVVYAIANGAYVLFDKAIDTLMLILTKWFHGMVGPIMEYTYLGRAFLSLALPQSRRRPKAVWALLFANDFTRLRPADKFAMSCKAMEDPHLWETYSQWADYVANEINATGLADQELLPKPPFRPLHLPVNPMVVNEEMAALAPLMGDKMRTMPSITSHVEDWVRQGVPRGIDGTWFATPDRIAASINRYAVDRPEPDDDTRLIVLRTAEALADKFPSMYRNAIYLTPAAAVKKIKIKYSPGLPFIPDFRNRKELERHGFMAAIARAAENRALEGVHPGTMAHAFVKMDVVGLQKLLEGKNIRTVIAQDLLGNATILPMTIETTRRLPPPEAFIINALPRSEGGVRPFYDKLRQRAQVFQADAHQYDSQLSEILSVDGLAHLRTIGYDGQLIRPIMESQIRASYVAMRHAKMVELSTGRVFERTGGLMTGQANTSVDNRDSFRMMIIAGWSIVTGKDPCEFWIDNDLGNAGDDDAIGTDEPREVWQTIFDTIRDRFGVTVELENEGFFNLDLIGLQVQPVIDQSKWFYTKVGVPVPDYAIASEPRRLLLKKTEFRNRLAGLRDIAFCMGHADVMLGSAMLTAHQPWIYEEFFRMYMDDVRPILLRYFERFSVEEIRDEFGYLIDTRIMPGPPRSRYIGAPATAIMKWLRAHRYPTYAQVFEVWTKPFEASRSSIAKSHRTLLGWNPRVTGLERFTYGLISVREMLYTWIPNHVVRALPEFTGEDVTYILRNPDYTIAKFVWLSLYHAGDKPRVPSASAFKTALRENPYASAEDPQGFLGWLADDKNLQQLAKEDLEAYRGKMLTVTLAYAFIEIIFKGLSNVYGLSILIHLYALSTRDVNRLYSLLNHIYMLGTGRSSIIISNLMPSDPYSWIKQFAVIIANIAPLRWHKFPGLKAATKVLPSLVEWWAAADVAARPHILRRYQTPDIPPQWLTLLAGIQTTILAHPPRSLLIQAPTGTGKSTALIGLIVREAMFANEIWLLCPTIVARDNYENVFISHELIQPLWRGVALRPGCNVRVLTYGHYITRLRSGDVPMDALVAFDEIHLGTVPMQEAWLLTIHQRKLGITATPAARYMPHFDELLKYPGERRFNVEEVRTAASVKDIWQQLAATRSELLTRALIVQPTLRLVEDTVKTLSRLSVPALVMASHSPQAPKRGVIVATSIVDTAVTIDPQPTVLLDSGKMLKLTPTIGSGQWLTMTVEIVDTSLSVHTQRRGRVGRHGKGYSFTTLTAGSHPELQIAPNPYELLRVDNQLVDAVLAIYGVRCPLDKLNDGLPALLRYVAADDLMLSPAIATSAGLAFYIFIHQSSGSTLDNVRVTWQNNKLSNFDDDSEEFIISEILDVTSYDALTGNWDLAIALLEQGFLQVRIMGEQTPCTGLYIDNGWIWPIGLPLSQRTMALQAYREPVITGGLPAVKPTNYLQWVAFLTDSPNLDMDRWYGEPPSRWNPPQANPLRSPIAGLDPRIQLNTFFTISRSMNVRLTQRSRPVVRIGRDLIDFGTIPGICWNVTWNNALRSTRDVHVYNIHGLHIGEIGSWEGLMVLIASSLPDELFLISAEAPLWANQVISRYREGLVVFFDEDYNYNGMAISPYMARAYAGNLASYMVQNEGPQAFAALPGRIVTLATAPRPSTQLPWRQLHWDSRTLTYLN